MLITLLAAAALVAAPGETRPATAAPPNVNIPLWAPGQVPLAQGDGPLDAPFLNTLQAGVQRLLSPELWDMVFLPILEAPSWLLPLILPAAFFVLARRKARPE